MLSEGNSIKQNKAARERRKRDKKERQRPNFLKCIAPQTKLRKRERERERERDATYAVQVEWLENVKKFESLFQSKTRQNLV